MIEIRKATQSDLDYVIAHPMNDEVVKGFKGVKISGDAVTGTHDGKILGVGGCVVYWKGVAEGWYALSEHTNNHKVSAVLCLSKMIEDLVERHNLHRLETTIRTDFEHAIKLVEFVGFKFEGIRKQYSEDKKDFCMYALIT